MDLIRSEREGKVPNPRKHVDNAAKQAAWRASRQRQLDEHVAETMEYAPKPVAVPAPPDTLNDGTPSNLGRCPRCGLRSWQRGEADAWHCMTPGCRNVIYA